MKLEVSDPIEQNGQEQEDQKEYLVLVGVGKDRLTDLMAMDPKTREGVMSEHIMKQRPNVYRRAAICTEEDKEAFLAFSEWITSKLEVRSSE